MLRMANPRERLRPPLPGGPDWEGGEHALWTGFRGAVACSCRLGCQPACLFSLLSAMLLGS